MSDLTYDVKIWTTRVYRGKRGNKYAVRWEVANKERARAHLTKKLAESFRSSLLSAARQGNAFDVATGLPEHMARQLATVTWYEHAMAFFDIPCRVAMPGQCPAPATATPGEKRGQQPLRQPRWPHPWLAVLTTCGTPACLFGSTLACLPLRWPSGPATASPSC